MSGWKPGDVAMYEYLGAPRLVALRVKGGNSKRGGDCPNPDHDVADHWHLSNGGWTRGTSDSIQRPLVVIDPEDREQVERLMGDYHRADGSAVDGMQAALREFANPKPPKPEEPTGLGAVVRLADGTRWIRYAPSPNHFWFHADSPTTGVRYDDLDVVEVLSEGVAP